MILSLCRHVCREKTQVCECRKKKVRHSLIKFPMTLKYYMYTQLLAVNPRPFAAAIEENKILNQLILTRNDTVLVLPDDN